MSLDLGSKIFADCSFSRNNPPYAIKGLNSFILKVTLNLDVKTAENCSRHLSNISGNLYWTGTSLLVGSAQVVDPNNIFSSKAQSISHQVHFQIPFDRQCIDDIEEKRLGCNATFNLKIVAHGLGLSDNSTSDIFAMYVHDTLPLRIEQSEWIKFLNDWDYGNHFLLEVGLSRPIDDQAKKAYEAFKVAHSLFLGGYWVQCVAECRKSFEALHLKIDPNAKLTELIREKKFNDLNERRLVLVLAAKDICHLASHSDDLSSSVRWGRGDAEFLLHNLAVCLKTFLQ